MIIAVKQICEQISELAASNVFLNGYPEFPYIENDTRLQSAQSVEENGSHQQPASEAKNNSPPKDSGSNWDAQKNKPIRLTIMDPVTSALPPPLVVNQKEKQRLVDGFEENKIEHPNRWGDMAEEEEERKHPQTQQQQSNQSQQQNNNGTPARSSRLSNWTSGSQDEKQPPQHVDKANSQRNHKPNQQQQQQQQQKSLGKRGVRGTRAGNHRGGQQRGYRRVSYHETDNAPVNK